MFKQLQLKIPPYRPSKITVYMGALIDEGAIDVVEAWAINWDISFAAATKEWARYNLNYYSKKNEEGRAYFDYLWGSNIGLKVYSPPIRSEFYDVKGQKYLKIIITKDYVKECGTDNKHKISNEMMEYFGKEISIDLGIEYLRYER